MKLALLAALMIVCGPVAYAGNPYCGPTYSRSYTPYRAPYAAPIHHAPVYQKHEDRVLVVTVPVPYAYDKPLALQGSTHYGFVKATEPYQPLNAPLYFDKGIRLQEQTLSVIQAGREAFESTLSQKIQADKEVAEAQIAANGMAQFAKEFFSGQARLKELSLANSSGEGVLRTAVLPADATGVLKASCVQCHEKYSEWESLDYETQFKIFSRVNHSDPSKRMPRAGDGKEEGEPLSDDEKVLLFPRK